MKKYLDLILLGCATLFSLLIFVWMALPGLKETIFDSTTNVYNLLDDGAGLVVAFVFMIVVFLVACCLCTLTLLKTLGKSKLEVPFAQFIALGAAVLALVAMILFFLTESIVYDGNTSEYVKLGAGAVLCAISALVSACGLCCFGLSKLLKK